MCCAFEVRLEVEMFIIWRLAIITLEIRPELPWAMQMEAKQNTPYKFCTPFYKSCGGQLLPHLSSMVKRENITTEVL